MFKKPFNAKTWARVRMSDLRKLRQELVNSKGPFFGGVGFTIELAKVALPDGTLTCRATTHLDEPVTLYSAPDGNPRFFRVGKGSEGALVPTCYTFDVFQNEADLLPMLVTADAVRAHLVSGAALFTAGVSPESLAIVAEDWRAGDLISVRCQSSALIAAVGSLAVSGAELVGRNPASKAALTLHARGDYLWHSGDGTVVSADLGELSEATSTNAVEREPGDSTGVLATRGAQTPPPAPCVVVETDWTPQEVEETLRKALWLAINQTLSKPDQEFPIPASSLYSLHILPNRPIGTPLGVDIKRSSSKKLTAFIKTAHKSGVLTSKEIKGELMIMSVDSSHPDVQSVQKYKTVATADTSSPGDKITSVSTSGACENAVNVRELYKPPSALHPFFGEVDHIRPSNDLYTTGELRNLLTAYVIAKNLVHPRDKAFLRLDDRLSISLLKPGETADVLKNKDAIQRLQSACQVYHSIRRGETGEVVFKKGAPSKVRIAVKTVGKRHVTLIAGHEDWDLFDSEIFAGELKVRSASSTSVQPLVGSAKKGQVPKVEIMCQGSHESLVTKMLVAKGIPKSFIECGPLQKRK